MLLLGILNFQSLGISAAAARLIGVSLVCMEVLGAVGSPWHIQYASDHHARGTVELTVKALLQAARSLHIGRIHLSFAAGAQPGL